MLSTEPILRWGKLAFDCNSYEIFWEDQTIELTPTELYILKYFMSNAESLITVAELIENVKDKNSKPVWPAEKLLPSDFTVRTHVNNLRHKFKVVGAPDPIERKRGLGYRLSRYL